jgi:hypothetical protein
MEVEYSEAFDIACKLLGAAVVREAILTEQLATLQKALFTEMPPDDQQAEDATKSQVL